MSTSLRLSVQIERFAVRGQFVIARGARTETVVVTAELEDPESGHRGRGESVPYRHYGETPEGVVERIEQFRSPLEKGLDRRQLTELLPAGAARNALDAALWDLESRRAGTPAWRAAGLDASPRVRTARTLSIDTPDAMAREAARYEIFGTLKLKLDGGPDLERVAAVREAAPRCRVVVDANESWQGLDAAALERRLGEFAEAGVAMVEQPLPASEDALLSEIERPLPVGADESFHVRQDLERCTGRYDVVNLKLDKTGGLTHALDARRAAEERGFDVMVGCMLSTSLSIAPALLLAPGAEFIDLDGPYLLAEDRDPPLDLAEDGHIGECPELWGGG